MMCTSTFRTIGLLLACSLALPVLAETSAKPDIQVREKDGHLELDMQYRLPVSPQVAWEVLTDFEGMPYFVPNLERSQVIERQASHLVVEQKGKVHTLLLDIPYDSKRTVDLVPYHTMHIHAVSGTPMDSTTQLTPEGAGETLLSYHSVSTPDLPIPASLITSMVGEMVGKQFEAMEAEMEKRAKAEAGGIHGPTAKLEQTSLHASDVALGSTQSLPVVPRAHPSR